ncbi:MAG: FAD-binding oxidoreductase [Hydrogenophaga sp.]|uniref:NAD(P)/FAD-dependent oxidoreductase n=1 Tax=Hydrogenophaga sp. TaxID=1904254 RepID=UPI0025C14E4A|nr:FAD-binding oxidoreductase [Hydrogenophaga sp.]MBT9549926.1 FAD-binding oxidoreductase [Hydrogenophaga sp.]
MTSGLNPDSTRADVAVVGAGIIGLSVAMHLVAQGRSVLLIDRKGIALEASAQNAGALAFSDILPLASPRILRQAPRWLLDPLGPLAIRPGYALQIAPWLLRFGMASRPSAYRASLQAQTQLMRLAAPAFHAMLARAQALHMIRQDGSLQVYEGDAEFRSSLPGWQLRAEAGIAFEHVQGERLRALQPGLASSITAGTFVPHWETVSDPFEVASALGRHVLQAGATWRQAEVRSIAVRDGGVALQLAQGSAVHANQAVIATGAWSRQLATQLGDAIPLDTERGYNTTLPPGAFDLQRQIIFGSHGFVVTPLSTGIRVGGAVELGGLKLPPNFKRSAHMLEKASRLLPGLRTEGGTQWMGYRPSLPDSLPVIGHAKASRRVVYAFGHGHLGLTQSGATGHLVAELLAGHTPSIPLEPFRPDRF